MIVFNHLKSNAQVILLCLHFFTPCLYLESKNIIIPSDITLGTNNTSEYALEIDAGGVGTITVTNNGNIIGAGGAGGSAGAAGSSGAGGDGGNGAAGGDAIKAAVPVTIVNNGSILAGGGGGAAGGGGGLGGNL